MANKTVILKDRDGNNIYPKVPYTNVFGIPHPINDDINIFYGDDTIPSTDATSFDDIKIDDIYIPRSRNADTPLFYRCKSISNSVITWDDYGVESVLADKLHTSILGTSTYGSGTSTYENGILTITYSGTGNSGGGFYINLHKDVDTIVDMIIVEQENVSYQHNWYVRGAEGLKAGSYYNLKVLKNGPVYRITIPSTAIETAGKKIELLHVDTGHTAGHTTLSNIKVFADYVSNFNYLGELFNSVENKLTNDGCVLVNKLYNSNIYGTVTYGTGISTYENGVITINYNYTGAGTYNGGGFVVKLYDGIKTIIKAKIDDINSYNNVWYVGNGNSWSPLSDYGGTSKVDGEYLIITIPETVIADKGNIISLINTGNKSTGYISISDIKIFAGGVLDFDGSYLGEYLEHMNSDNSTKYINKKILFLGDSVTALSGNRGWSTYFNNKLKPELSVNLAVPQSRWCDYEDTVYDGNPTSSNLHNNTMGNQIEKILRGKDETHPNYSRVEAYQHFDIIMIAEGSNDNPPTEDIEPFFTNNHLPVDISTVDKMKFAGAFRYAIENLQRVYPNAKIFICTPIQAVDSFRTYDSMNIRRNYLKELANRISVEHIDTFECGICGMYEIWHSEGRDLIDGLHPNASGAKKIGYYNAKNVINKYIE